ncbi:DUF11 domain-containing protein [Deinococcus radiopugnans]|uniref:DUF11 domain-containing protein n=1 Tax=Deinococcus radiopugnans ATCC 19172 TaxID=585398 RepID=A0A5C4Y6A6_9DEIO|nr:DUF11 domain-containing protein [Deinococcus radiopugnans]MBB6017182.1 putative repeat protein (TIGR01451 family) [Deinococcus radiopugnans ATCC 19172]TNM70501.1 DUF11 domain-containing protein [Deinococcus radiopugnans ATCC 19172]
MTRSRFVLPALLLGLLLPGAHAGAQTLTPAGTVITNQAQAEFLSPPTGQPTVVRSNVVQTTVAAVCAVSVTPDGTVAQPGQSAALLPGEAATFVYKIVNAGNATSTFGVSARTEAGGISTPGLKLVRDLNGNGKADTNEPEISSVTLDADRTADVLLLVEAISAGDAFVNLVAGCAGGQSDSNNVSVVRISPPPALSVSKSFSPALLRPGAETTVTVKTTNGGQGQSREVILTDLLTAQLAQGLSFVAGSASSNAGTLEYTEDGTVWTAIPGTVVRGVRVRVPSLAPGADLTLTFRMRAGASAENKVIPNTATVLTGKQTVSDTARVDVRYQPAVAIGPQGNPEAPEGTAADRQSRVLAVLGQPVCFDHTAKNTGDVKDAFTLSVGYPTGRATAVFYGEGGQPLAQPLLLDAGQSAPVRVCYSANQTGPLDALITIRGERGTSNATSDAVDSVEGGLPELVKSSVATAQDGQTAVTLPAGATVATGDTITYRLMVRNPYTRPLTGVVVSDKLTAHLDFVSATDGGLSTGAEGAQTVQWTLETLAPNETRVLTVVTRVSPRAVDGEALKNIFQMVSTQTPDSLSSNEVMTPVWTAKLAVNKDVNATEVTVGDRLSYTLTVTNKSATTSIIDARIKDTPAKGLSYIPGSSRLGGQPLADPQIKDGVLTWSVAELPAGVPVTLTYDTRVTADAAGELVNTVEVSGVGAGGVARAIASNQAVATVKLRLGLFAPLSDILGVVYVDRNRDGRYQEGLDTPLPRARVLLAGGRQTLTDPQGRYSFANVVNGTQALRLDPLTTPYPPLPVPRDGGLSGTQTVFVNGLTGVDFPLAPLGGEIAALRRTTLTVTQGDTVVTLEKAVYAVEDGYVVTLDIQSPRVLEGVELLDPLPAGATLKDGRKTLPASLPAGETNLTYRFAWNGEPRAATTDPTLSWRN